MNRIAFLVLVLASACARERASGAKAPPNVVLICLDTVRADHLGAYGYGRATTPALDRLAERARVFTDVSAAAGWTKPSVPSFMTGTYPCQHGVYEGSVQTEQGETTDVLPEKALTLAEVFRQSGYRTGAFVHNKQLGPGTGFEQGFELYHEANMDARAIRWQALDWLDRADGRPWFLYLHFLDAHWPYEAPAEWSGRFAPLEETAHLRGRTSKALYASVNEGERELSAADRAGMIAAYDGALAYVDHELGRLLEGLALRSLADDTIVCVVADHGEEFGEHGRVGHGHGLSESLLRVPWILSIPGHAPQRLAAPVSLVDLFPTLLSAAGIPAPPGLEGVDRLERPDAEVPLLAEHKTPDQYLQSLRVGGEKLRRTFTAPANADLARMVLPISAGTRWEAEFVLVGEERVATQLKPRAEDAAAPPEVKGRIEALGAHEFRIAGIAVRYDEHTPLQMEPGAPSAELAEGRLVKVRGAHRDGTLLAERIRIYPDQQENPSEIRGTVERVEQAGGRGHLVLSGFPLAFTRDTELREVASAPRPRSLSRMQVAALLDSGGAPWAEAQGFACRTERFDLLRDPGELRPEEPAPGSALEQALEQLGTRLARARFFAPGDERALDAQTLRALEDIGYGGN